MRGRAYARKVNKDGRVIIDDEYYYVKQSLAGQNVVLTVNAEEQVFEVWWKSRTVRKLPIRGLVGHELAWQEYVSFITEQARSGERQAALRRPHLKQLPLGW